jgi:hypothetical protein
MSIEKESRTYNEIGKIRNGRQQMHGAAKVNFEMIAKLWSAYTGAVISAEDVGFMMSMLKASRYKGGDKHNFDNFVDAANYIALAGDMSNPYIDKPITQEEDRLNEDMFK